MKNKVIIKFENEILDISVGVDCINTWPTNSAIAQAICDVREQVRKVEKALIENDSKIRAQKNTEKD